MPNHLFAALESEWQTLRRVPAIGPDGSPWPDPALTKFRTLGELIDALRRDKHDHTGNDRILVALARRAPVDDLAARTLLQAVLPGLFNVGKRLGRGHIDDELEAEVLAEAVVRIRTYPIERRPARIAANVTWDVFGRLARRRQQAKNTPVDLVADVVLPTSTGNIDPSIEVCDLVHDAVERGALRARDARLLLAIAVGHDTIAQRARREGIAYAAMNERWRRARKRLQLAVAA
ncbi:MAG: hypothetical protein WD598_08135 [Acidimicrobiia bacterium]